MRLSAEEPLRRSFKVGTFAGRNQAAICGRLTRPREFLFGQHPGRSGPVWGSGEVNPEIFRAMNSRIIGLQKMTFAG
jgi:hypothetical protein